MNARQSDIARAMTQAMQRAATGSSARITAWSRADQIGATSVVAGQAVPVMDTDGLLYFLADYDEADGTAIAG